MSSLSFVLRTFDWDGGTALSGEEGVRTGVQLLPKCVKKNMISRQTPAYFSTLDLTQIFE